MDSDLTSEACDLCGQDAVIEMEGKGWCASCLHARGSCCGELLEMEDPDQAAGDITFGACGKGPSNTPTSSRSTPDSRRSGD
jgi:hypothetical protein